MAITNGYCTLADVKGALALTDSIDDTELELAIESASRLLDDTCDRRFWADTSATARFYTPSDMSWICTDDIASATGLLVDIDQDSSGTFATPLTIVTDFNVTPYNAGALTPAEPYTKIEVPLTGRYRFLERRARMVRVTAKWGWPATPTDVKQATKIQAIRLFKRKDAPFGTAGSVEFGTQLRLLSRLDPDVELLVRRYVRLAVA